MATPFKGVIKLDVRDSTPDWEPFLPTQAPEGAPNVLIVLYDDTGLAAWSPFGGRINMPTLQRLADNGLTLHAVAHDGAVLADALDASSPDATTTRTAWPAITEGVDRLPGRERAHPAGVRDDRARSCATTAGAPSGSARTTTCPVDDVARRAAPKQNWPLAAGLRPLLRLPRRRDQPVVSGPRRGQPLHRPAVHARGGLPPLEGPRRPGAHDDPRRQAVARPSRPWYLWFCPGANHAPHHAPQEYIDKYKGKFDDGYEAYREWVLPRMIEKGILPEGTELTPINPMPEGTPPPADDVRPWDSLSDDEKRLFCAHGRGLRRLLRVHRRARSAGSSTTSRRPASSTTRSIFYCADNGASGEGTPERLGQREQVLQRLARRRSRRTSSILDELGSPDTYNHYPTGWAVAFSTPFQMFKRYSLRGRHLRPAGHLLAEGHQGARARSATSTTTSTDIVPTILDVLRARDARRSSTASSRSRSPGVSMRYTFDAADAPTPKKRQYYAMLGTRGIWQDGWKAVTVHGPTSGIGPLRRGRVAALPHRRGPRRGARPRRPSSPSKLKELIAAWFEEAEQVRRPAARRPLRRRDHSTTRGRSPSPPRARTSTTRTPPRCPRRVAANIRGRSFKILAEVEIDDARGRGRDLRPRVALRRPRAVHQGPASCYYVYNFLGIPPEQQFVVRGARSPGKYMLGVEFTKERIGEHHESIGTTKLYVERQGRGRGPDAGAGRHVHAVRRRPLRRPRPADAVSSRVQVARPRSPAARSTRSRSTSATTSTSTSSGRPRRCSPASSPVNGQRQGRLGHGLRRAAVTIASGPSAAPGGEGARPLLSGRPVAAPLRTPLAAPRRRRRPDGVGPRGPAGDRLRADRRLAAGGPAVAAAGLVGYGLLGTSKQLIVSPTSSTAAISASLVAAIALDDASRNGALSAALALLVGIVFLILGFAGIGFISRFIPTSVQVGFMFGLGLTIIVGQLTKILGVPGTEGSFFEQLRQLLGELGAVNGWTVALGWIALRRILVAAGVAGASPPR